MSTKFDDYACAADCELLAEMEQERDTWALAARMLVRPYFWAVDQFGEPYDDDPPWGRIAAAYAIASLGSEWREVLEEQ